MVAPLLMVACLVAQAPPRDASPQRDAAPPRIGTGIIRGRVTAADTSLPLRGAVVSLSGGPGLGPNASPTPGTGTEPVTPRNVAANTDGTFEFSRLPPGTYRLRVVPGRFRARYLPMAFGGRGPVDVGKPIELADGQTFEADLALPRGGAIEGRVVDDYGEPVSGVTVSPRRVTAGGSFVNVALADTRTDDQGRFRLYGLMPDVYIVGAEPSNGSGHGEAQPEGFAITYYPSAFTEREATQLRVSAGQDSSVVISLIRTRTFRITGTLLDSHRRSVEGANAVLARVTAGGQSFYSGSFSFDGQGRFSIRDVAPGEYVLMVRPDRVSSEGSVAAPPPGEFARVPLTVSANIDDLVVVTQPGSTIAGRVVFAEGAPPAAAGRMRIMTQVPVNSYSMGSTPSADVGGDQHFTLRDLFGPYYIRPANLPPGHVLKAVTLDGRDITDTLIEFKPEHDRRLQVVLTRRTAILDGTVTDERGEPVSEVSVITLPEDRSSWRFGSFRMRITTASDGKFRLEGLLPGRYQVVAIPRDRLRPSLDVGAEQLEPYLQDAATVVLAEQDKQTVALKVARGQQEP
jgi:protocatechuate 3,4-dioxygenase beta subunit